MKWFSLNKIHLYSTWHETLIRAIILGLSCFLCFYTTQIQSVNETNVRLIAGSYIVYSSPFIYEYACRITSFEGYRISKLILIAILCFISYTWFYAFIIVFENMSAVTDVAEIYTRLQRFATIIVGILLTDALIYLFSDIKEERSKEQEKERIKAELYEDLKKEFIEKGKLPNEKG